MKTDTHSVRRRVAACGLAVLVLPVISACGTDIDPPAQDISREKVQKTDDAVPVPARTSGNRLDFRDEYGTREVTPRRTRPADDRSLNRLDFRDRGW